LVLVIGACAGRSTRTTGGTGGADTHGDDDMDTPSTGGTTAVAPAAGGSSSTVGGSGGTAAVGGPVGDSGGRGSIAGVGTSAGRGSTGAAGMATVTCSKYPNLGTWENTDAGIFLSLTSASGGASSTLKLADGKLPPDPTSPDEEWPPGYWTDDVLFSYPEPPGVTPGFTYTLLQPEQCGDTVHFSIATPEPWGPWCQLQTPLQSNDDWACILRGNGSSVNHTDGCTTYENGQLLGSYPEFMCPACGGDAEIGYCTCNRDTCSANLRPRLAFELVLYSEDRALLNGAGYLVPVERLQ